jgi:hypothetical protein
MFSPSATVLVLVLLESGEPPPMSSNFGQVSADFERVTNIPTNFVAFGAPKAKTWLAVVLPRAGESGRAGWPLGVRAGVFRRGWVVMDRGRGSARTRLGGSWKKMATRRGKKKKWWAKVGPTG